MLAASLGERIEAMNETTIDLDQADEDILTYDVSDEALEAAAGTEGGSPPATTYNYTLPAYICC
jgi:hypothetical protein